MVAILAIATLLDLALAALMAGVSGFILEGVNSTGPQMPAAMLLVAFIAFAVAAPLAAWLLRGRGWSPFPVASLAWAPVVVAAATLLLEPAFTG